MFSGKGLGVYYAEALGESWGGTGFERDTELSCRTSLIGLADLLPQ